MGRPGAECAQAQRIERNIQRYEAVLGCPEDEVSVKTCARKDPRRKKQE